MRYATIEQVAERFSDPMRTESLAELVAMLSEEDQLELMGEELNSEALLYDWNFWGRPKQIIPEEPYFNVHLFLTGRGFGKTRAGAEWVRSMAIKYPGCRIGLLGRTAAEVRDIVVNGESGILGIDQPESERPEFKPSTAELIWPNGSKAKLYSAEKPDAVRGAQFHFFWADELASYTPFVGPDGLTAFDNAKLATRLGEHPTMIITTTPKRVASVRKLLDEAADGKVRVVRGSTSENSSNLANVYMESIYGAFEGTAVARQELDGDMLDEDPEGALWTEDTIQYEVRSEQWLRSLPIRIVAVDPTVAAKPTDECGIVAIGATNEKALHRRNAYVLEDASLRASPEDWAQEAVRVYHDWNASAMIVEKNQGHHLLTMAINNIDPSVNVIAVNAGTSKALRAEPVAQVYQQGRVFHAMPGYPLLETQMKTWEPNITKESPDRVDALVHGLTALLLTPPPGMIRGTVKIKSASGHKLPTGIGTGRSRGFMRGKTGRR